MPVRLVVIAATAALVTACQGQIKGHGPGIVPIVLTDEIDCRGKGTCPITLDPVTGAPPESVLATKETRTAMIWKIPQESKLRFDSPGIEFAKDAGFDCQSNPTPNEKIVACTNNGKPNGHYYTVRLKRRDNSKFEIDPFVWNF